MLRQGALRESEHSSSLGMSPLEMRRERLYSERRVRTIAQRLSSVRVLVGLGACAILAVGGAMVVRAGTATAGDPNDPGIQQCQLAQGICNQTAENGRRARNPEAKLPSSSPTYISRATAEEAARIGALTPLTPAAPPNAVVFSQLVSRADFETITGVSHNPAVYSTRMVWLVTVHAPMATDGSPSRTPEIKPVYSVAFDAETGQWTDACIGCGWLQTSK